MSKKHIGIVTFFKSYNYGVWLQAYATQKFLQKSGYSVEIVNYTNKYDDSKLRYSYKEGNRLYGYITSFLKSVIFGKTRYYKKGFKKNLKRYYNLTNCHYNNVKQMENIEFDCLIAGSDQIWNPETTNNQLDKAFLLQFGRVPKRISYASSIGSTSVREIDKPFFKDAFKRFHRISVRENFALKELSPLTEKEIKVVLDPTFLLNKQDWCEFSNEFSSIHLGQEKYILTYFVSTDKYSYRYIQMVNEYAKKFNLKVYSIQFSSYYGKGCDRKILGASIADFIKLINGAEIVISDSFHGVAMSLNLGKNFVAIKNRKNPTRTRELLSKLDLLNRIDLLECEYSKVNYEKVNPILELLRNDSKNWLLSAINE